MAAEQRMTIGVLGAGHLGRIHIQQLLEIPEWDLVGFYDPDPEKTAKIHAEFGIPVLGSVAEVVARASAVDIVTPTLSHHDCAAQALQAGRHVFIEKPLSNTLAEGRDLVDRARSSGLRVQVGHVERFNPAFRAVEGALNEPMFIEAHRLAQFNPRGTDVPVVLDLMVHDIDIVLSTVRSPIRSIHASGVAVVSDSPDICNARILFANGCVANLTASRISLKNMRKARFFQRDAYISVDMLDKKAEIVRMTAVDGEPDPFAACIDLGPGRGLRRIMFENPEVVPSNAIREELREFAAAIREHRDPAVTVADGFATLEVAHGILEAMRGETVVLS